MTASSGVLNQDFTLGFTYTRSTGPVVGRFLGALKNKSVVGIRGSDGRVIVPPVEFDPATAAALDEFVAVGNTGTVTNWTWVSEPREQHLRDKPFAWVMVQLDGADTPILHMLDADGPDAVSTGMQVRIRWADETRGHITDIAGFEPA